MGLGNDLIDIINLISGGNFGGSLKEAEYFNGGNNVYKDQKNIDYIYDSLLKDKENEIWKWQQSNANQLKMQDMQKAGINPMAEYMTATGGTSGASAPATAPLSSAGGTSKLGTELLKTLKEIQKKL